MSEKKELFSTINNSYHNFAFINISKRIILVYHGKDFIWFNLIFLNYQI